MDCLPVAFSLSAQDQPKLRAGKGGTKKYE